MKFTDRLIRNLKPKKNRYDLREKSGHGFVIRVTPNGHKSWIFLYNFNGKKYRLTLGAYPSISLAEAHELHRNAVKCLANGKNPIIEKQKVKVAERTAGTVNDLIEEYLEKWAKPRKRSWQEDERILKKDVAPIIGKYKAKDVTKRDVVLILDAVVERGSPIACNRTLAVVRRMFNFAVERDIISSTPCYSIKALAKENRRERLLSEEEIKVFWNCLGSTGMSELTRLALKLQLATGQRKGEIASAEWEEFDLINNWWTIPCHKAKNNTTHRVHLSKLALGILQKIKLISDNPKWLFPSPVGNTHIAPEAINHAIRKNVDKFHGLNHFTPHDLRRTAASHMTAIGIPRLVVSKILNHVENTVTAIYDRHSYDAEKKDALEKWGIKLSKIISDN